MNTIIEKLKEMLVVPVVVLDDVKDAEKLADALVGGGLPCAEVTFRTAAAEESIRIMTEKYPDMLVGAGTVLTTEQVDKAVAAGAKFIVSPGFDAEIVDYCLDKNIPILPGVISPSEAAQAVKRGLSVVKFFPAEQYGGVTTIKALAAPYTMLKFMPRNLLLNEKNELHNRNLHISALFNNRKVDIGSEKVDIQDKKVDIESVLSEKGKDFSRIVFLLNFLLHI